jgi:hypothetical protein
MTLSNEPSKKGGREIPFDFSATRKMPTWRQDLCWPVTPIEVVKSVKQGFADYLDLIADQPEPDIRRLLLVAGPEIIKQLLLMLDYARSVQNSDAAGIELISDHSEFNYFNYGGTPKSREAAEIIPAHPVVPRHPLVRKLINIASWTPLWKAPASFLFPTVTAFSANSHLLHQHVSHSGVRLTFRDPGHYLIEARALSQATSTVKAEEFGELADLITTRFAASGALGGIYLDRFLDATRIDVETILKAVQKDLLHLRKIKLPKVAWTGSSIYQSRVVGHEIIRKGGEVVKFDHGGSTGMNGWPERDAFVELNGATRLVMATNAAADFTKRLEPEKLIASVHHCEIVGGAGYPHLKHISRSHKADRKRKERRVMYCPTFFRAHSSNPGETMGEPIHMDFTLRVAEALMRLPIDLVLKPHPQAVSPDGRHYTQDVARVSYEKFEDIMDDVDIFIFDVINSTTFWEAVCTQDEVILINLGSIPMDDDIMRMLKRRCTVLDTEYDEAGKPQIDLQFLEQAIMAPAHSADPTEFRRLLAHDE